MRVCSTWIAPVTATTIAAQASQRSGVPSLAAALRRGGAPAVTAFMLPNLVRAAPGEHRHR
jgi:hypothetical protein